MISAIRQQINTSFSNITPQTAKEKSDAFIGFLSSAATKVAQLDDGDKVLGLAMIPEPGTNRSWGMAAKYAATSTKDNPIVQVSCNYGGEPVFYNININEVDPSNASRLEMFALSAYGDDQGMGTNNTFGTYNTMRYYQENANELGIITAEDGLEAFENQKFNWLEICEEVMKSYLKGNLLNQYSEGTSLLNLFSKYPNV